MDTNDARRNGGSKLHHGGSQGLRNHLNNHPDSKMLNTRSHTQMAQYQSTGQVVNTLDKDKIMSKAYLGRTQNKNVM